MPISYRTSSSSGQRRRPLCGLIASGLVLLCGQSAHAASDSWNVNAAGSWITPGNWLSNTQVPGSTTTDNTDVATFGFTLTAARVVTVDATRFIGGISFGNTSAFGYTLSSGALNLNSGGVIQTLAANGAHTDTISAPITIDGTSAATATFTAGASNTSLLSIGAVKGSATAGNTTTLTLNGTSTGAANAVTGIVGDGSGGGTLTITKSGTGSWLLSGANTYTGATTVSAGTLKLGSATALGSTAGGTTVTSGAVLDLAGQAIGAEAVTISGTGISSAGALISSTGFSSMTSPLTLAANASIGGAAVTTLSGGISGGAFTLTKTGGGTLALSGTNSYTGGTTVAQGVLSLLNTAAKPATGTITVAALSTLALGVGGTGFYSSADVDALFTNTMAGVTLNATSQVGIDTTAGDFTYSSAQAGTRSLVKVGLNTLTLTGNAYTGVTTVLRGGVTVTGDQSAANGGWLIANSDNSSTQTVNFNAGSTVAVAAGKTFQIGSPAATGAAATVNASGTVNNSGALNVQRAAAYTITNGGVWTQSGAMMINPSSGSGIGTVMTVASGGNFIYNNSATSLIQVSPASGGGGPAALNISGTFTTNQGFTNTTTATTGIGATITLAGGVLKLAADIPVLTATAGSVLNFALGAGGGTIDTQSFAATMNRPISGTTGLTKAGTGTFTLSASNTYTGPTNVTGGTLEISGSIGVAAGAAVSVTSGTLLLSGAGTDRVTDASTLTLTSGKLAYADGLTGAGETVLSLTLGGSGTLDFGASSSNTFGFTNGVFGLGSFSLAVWDWTGADTFTLGGVALTSSELAQISFYSDKGSTFLGNGALTSGSLGYAIVPVPEPAALTSLAGGLGLLLGLQRRRRRSTSV